MKKIVLLPILLLIVACSSSDSSSEVNNPVSASIVGKWTLEKIVKGGVDQGVDNCEKQNYLIFSPTNVIYMQEYYTGTENQCFEQTPSQGTYSLEGNTLSHSYSFSSYQETVSTLTDTKLVLLVDKRYNGPDGGEIFTVTYKRVAN